MAMFITTGCLDKLENLTEVTKDRVTETKDAIIETRDIIKKGTGNQELGFWIGLMSTDPNANIRAFNVVNVINNATMDQLFVLFGMSRPLKDEMLDPVTPNVSLIGENSDPVNRRGAITPKLWGDQATGCKNSFYKIMKDATEANTSIEDLNSIPDRVWRSILVCTAVAGALPQSFGLVRKEAFDKDPDAERARVREQGKRDWPRDEQQLKDYKTIQSDMKDLITKAMAVGKLTADQSDWVLKALIPARLDNNFEEAMKHYKP